ncbi:MAG TPA: HYR domain-containing protein, partial [Planctomycetota bacterium]|nr:HYR domain-containing protein [Planctomycetota bacterium]
MIHFASCLRRLSTILCSLALFGQVSASQAWAQSVATDRADYMPGETALISGSGFHANEVVTLEVEHENPVPPGGGGHEPWEVTTDENGDFSSSWYVDPDDSYGSILTLVADCPHGSHAETTFTDACGDGTVIVSPVSGCLTFTAGHQGNPDFWEVVEGGIYALTVTGVTDCAGSTITIYVRSASTGNFCFPANRIVGTDDFTATMTMPSPACFDYQIGYRCGTVPCSLGFSGALLARGPVSGCAGVRLRASLFDAACHRIAQDESCTGCTACVLTPPANKVVECGQSTAPSNTGTPTGCAGATFTDVEESAICPAVKVISRRWSAPDGCGGVSSVSQTITVVDTTPPSISAPGANASLECPGVPSFTAPTAVDSCGTATVEIVSDVTTPGCGNTYSRKITWRAVDACGNASDPVSQTIAVVDTTAPTITAPGANGSVECPATPSFTAPTAFDGCGSATIQVVSDVTTPACGNTYSRKITWRAVDACGNASAPVSQTIAVVDTTGPILFCPPDKVFAPGAGCSATGNIGSATATDACGGAVIITNNAPSTFPAGITTITWTAKDACNNLSSCQQRVSVGGQICALKFYDANANGIQDGVEPVIPGWKFIVTNVATGVSQTAYTGSNGIACFNVEPGNFAVAEITPSNNWVATTQPWAVTIGAGNCSAFCTFGNYCFSPPANGYTLGFWSNKNGSAVLLAHDPEWRQLLNALNLKNANGTDFVIPTGGSGAAAFDVFRTWILGAHATNMAYMLSAQLAATTLDVQYKGLADSTNVIVPGGVKTGANVCIVPFLAAVQGI